jgi:cytidylate kinase
MDLIFLHGPAASGKLTTARALGRNLNYPVFHNHLVVDLLTTVFPFGSEPFVRLREQMWTSVFADAARAGTSLIFTFAPESTVAHGFPQPARVSQALRRRSAPTRSRPGEDRGSTTSGSRDRHRPQRCR